MNDKQYAIEILEKALKDEEERLEKCYLNLKTYKDEVAHIEGKVREALVAIAGLKDGIHKLKGLANLEEANKL